MAVQHLNTLDIRNAISHIREKQDKLLAACDTHERSNSFHSEIALVMAASDCEIEMTNFANDLRDKMTAGVVG
jgi:Zn-dependent oligopeptidase